MVFELRGNLLNQIENVKEKLSDKEYKDFIETIANVHDKSTSVSVNITPQYEYTPSPSPTPPQRFSIFRFIKNFSYLCAFLIGFVVIPPLALVVSLMQLLYCLGKGEIGNDTMWIMKIADKVSGESLSSIERGGAVIIVSIGITAIELVIVLASLGIIKGDSDSD